MSNKTLNRKQYKNYKLKPNDVFHTHPDVAKIMIKMCDIKPTDTVLDPCAGDNKVFYKNFPECLKEYCEITEDKDFFKYDKKVDWVIGNPPYSLWNKWLDHTMEITDKFCYIFGIFNLTCHRIGRIFEKGYNITKIHFCKVDYWFGISWLVLFEKNKPSIVNSTKHQFNCPDCGKMCGRGITKKGVKQSPNICYLKVLENQKSI